MCLYDSLLFCLLFLSLSFFSLCLFVRHDSVSLSATATTTTTAAISQNAAVSQSSTVSLTPSLPISSQSLLYRLPLSQQTAVKMVISELHKTVLNFYLCCVLFRFGFLLFLAIGCFFCFVLCLLYVCIF